MIQPQLDYYDMGKGVVAFSSTRHGGCSEGNYASFNINRYCGDQEDCILKNREALCQMLGISNNRLVMPHQVHLTKVAKIDEQHFTQTSTAQQEALEGVDALMTDLSDVCIGVSTADCIPILLYDNEHHAVCAVHAGWRGTVQRIVVKAIEAMTAAYGTQPQQLMAQIGPGIHLDSFEVGDEVYEAFDQAGFEMELISKKFPSSDSGSKLFTFHSSFFTSKWHIDLPECNRLQLITAGLSPQNIKVSPVCTYQQAADYFSARHLGIDSGRIFTGIMLENSQSTTMNRIERIKQMEQHLDRASQAVMRLSAALDDYEAVQEAIRQLSAYYDSDDWKKDFADDEQGRLPQDLKRGVLSEDGIWNLLEDHREVTRRMQQLFLKESDLSQVSQYMPI